jgi:hypothetical protein
MGFYKIFVLIFMVLLSSLSSSAVGQNRIINKSSVLVLSQDDLFKKSVAGRALLKAFEEKQALLFSEASKVEQDFILEEQKLTDQRLILTPTDFQVLADEFDSKVEKMRKFRTNKDKKLQQDFIRWRKKFVQIVLPIVRELMAQYEASVVIDTINRGLIYDQTIDVTDIIIKRLDEEFLSNPRILEKIILVN